MTSERGSIRVGTRASALARAQTLGVTHRLAELGWSVETVLIQSAGDADRTVDAPELPRGAFVSALEDAVLSGEVDIAVHSAKDLPTEERGGLVIAAYPERADVRDAIVTRDGTVLGDLPDGARIGTGSPRRRAFLLRERPANRIASIRGNVDTRISKVDAGEYDAIVIAAAGLDRLGLGDRAAERLGPDRMLPAAGQGALAVQVREGAAILSRLAALDDAATRSRVTAERSFLGAMGGGCRTPLAGLAEIDGADIVLRAAALDPDGQRALFNTSRGTIDDPEGVGRRAADRLLEAGAGSFVGV